MPHNSPSSEPPDFLKLRDDLWEQFVKKQSVRHVQPSVFKSLSSHKGWKAVEVAGFLLIEHYRRGIEAADNPEEMVELRGAIKGVKDFMEIPNNLFVAALEREKEAAKENSKEEDTDVS